MDSIDVDDLYDERSDVAWSRPIFQGDIFKDVTLPGFDDGPLMVQIIAHPCAMRSGPNLVSRVTVAPVRQYQPVSGAGKTGWDGHLRVMPLADLLGDGRAYASKFIETTAAPSKLLTFGNRIATLSNRGIYVLQQRLIKHYTRLTVDIPVLREELAAVLEEAEQERDWIETVLDGQDLTVEAIRIASKDFDTWLSEGTPSRRDKLHEDSSNHRDIRHKARNEAAKRAQARTA